MKMNIEDYAAPPPTRWERIRSKMATIMGRIKMYILTYMYNYVLWPVRDHMERLLSIGQEVIQFIIYRNPISSLINWHYHPARRNISWFTWFAEAFITIECMVVGAFIVPGMIVVSIVYLGWIFGFWAKDIKAILDSIIEYIEYILGKFGIHVK